MSDTVIEIGSLWSDAKLRKDAKGPAAIGIVRVTEVTENNVGLHDPIQGHEWTYNKERFLEYFDQLLQKNGADT